ncbi:MAG: response regulator [Acidobacteria bacterium]|nr:response regulator [Acidobacteriota bacterium]
MRCGSIILCCVIGLFLSMMRVLPAAAAPASLPGQKPSPQAHPPNGRPGLKIFTTQDGIPQSALLSLAFDQKGYLWAGTQDGAARYNGQTWQVINLPERFVSNYIRTVLGTGDGSVWFGTRNGGLARFKDNQWTTFNTSNGLPSNAIFALVETSPQPGQSTLWVGTDAGLVWFDGQSWKRITTGTGLPGNNITCLHPAAFPDGQSGLWVGTDRGLVKVTNQQVQLVSTSSNLRAQPILSLWQSPSLSQDKPLWVATATGLFRIANGTETEVIFPTGFSSRGIRCLTTTLDAGGTESLWVGVEQGLLQLKDGDWTRYDQTSGLPTNTVISLLRPHTAPASPTLWIGTGRGLVRLTDNSWRSFGQSDGLPDDEVYSIHETKDQTLWIGTENGLARWEATQRTIIQGTPPLPKNRVLCLYETTDPQGDPTLWVGTSGGLVRFHRGNWSTVSEIPSGSVRHLLETTTPDGKKVLWAATQFGLARAVDGQWTFMTRQQGLPSNMVLSVLETRSPDGTPTIWAGTDSGLGRWLNGVWNVFTIHSGLPNNIVRALHESIAPDGTQMLWIGSSGGVARLTLNGSQSSWETLSDQTIPALPNNVIYQIREDDRGRLYLTTNKGVVQLTPPADLKRVPRMDEYVLHTFTTEDGLAHDEANSGASWIDQQGRLWVGTVGGMAVYDTRQDPPPRSPSPLLIEQVQLWANAGQGWWWGSPSPVPATVESHPVFQIDRQALAYQYTNLVFQYALLEFFRDSETRYRTQLIGYDTNPSGWSTDPKREYTNLPNGQYVFQVWAKNYAGTINGPVSVTFSIRPAPWKTWWAYLFFAVTLGGLGYGLVQFRLRSLNQRTQWLEDRVLQRTQELAATIEHLRQSEYQAHQAHQEAIDEKRNAQAAAQEAIEAKNKAIEANRAKTTFLANMSHELRTPLNAILGFAQVMDRKLNRSAEDLENLAVIRRSSEHLLGLINDILDVARLEAGRMTLNEHVFHLSALLRSLEEMFRLRAHRKDLQFEFSTSPDLPEYTWADEGKLRQVLIKLLENAFKYTGIGYVAFRATWSESGATFEIEDTGQGIRPDDLQVIFEAFAQSQHDQKYKEGIGLGLTICEKFVRLMGGTLEVKSQPGEGSTFRVHLPLQPVNREDRVAANKHKVIGLAAGQPQFRVLVADGKWENIALLDKMLTPLGFKVILASDGKEAIDHWVNHRPHVVLIDGRLPIWDGYTTTKKIRQLEMDERLSSNLSIRTVILAVTSSSFEFSQETLLEAGFDDHLNRPIREEMLLRHLAEHLGIQYQYEATDSSETAHAENTPSTQLTPEVLSALPQELISNLQKALNEGNISVTEDLASQIENTNPALALEIRQYLKGYQFDELLELIDQGTRQRQE